ncbi:MAG: hypothetical protein O7E52_02215 [Candidatus Poribacteria bacterium]|nr:hypothetical protein [Candidatus Poribacteria bacterium]
MEFAKTCVLILISAIGAFQIFKASPESVFAQGKPETPSPVIPLSGTQPVQPIHM